MCFLYPHDWDKLTSNFNSDFKSLPIKDKVKSIAKFALPFFGYPALALAGLAGLVKEIQKFEEKNPPKETKFRRFVDDNSENIKKYGNLALFPILAAVTSILGIKYYNDIPKNKIIKSSLLFAGIAAAVLTFNDKIITAAIETLDNIEHPKS